MTARLIALQNRFLGRGETIYDRLARLREEKGSLRSEDLLALARETNLPPAHVRSVAKFYDELAQERPAKRKVRVCNGEPCAIGRGAIGRGAIGGAASGGSAGCHDRLAKLASADVHVGEVTCLGHCGTGPNALVEDEDGARVVSLAEGGLEALEAALSAGASIGLAAVPNAVFRARDPRANVLLARFGPEVVPLSRAREAGAYRALEAALKSDPQRVIDEVKASQLRGRGGAGFPTGVKLQTVRDAPSARGDKYVVVNGDEGDAGAFIDKELCEQAPHAVIEGMLLAAYAAGASEGYLYVRGEYPRALEAIDRALGECRQAGLLGKGILGSKLSFEATLVRGHGAYVCGEETSLLRSLEGVPAQVSPKPPFPAIQGLRGAPTAVNNVETLAALPWIVEHGGAAYAALGHGKSRGTKLVSLSGKIACPGLYEVELGTPLRAIVFELGGGVPNGKAFKAMQLGGPLGGILGPAHLDLPLDFEAIAKAGGMLGHASLVVFDEDVDLVRIGRGLERFCAIESCGKCFPCRLGSVRATEIFDKILEGRGTQDDLELLAELNETMEVGSLCALGGGIPVPIKNLLTTFVSDFAGHVPDAQVPLLLRSAPSRREP